MNTNSNTYTVVYAAVLVAVVAGILAFVSTSLGERQKNNVALEKKQLILRAAGIGSDTPASEISALWDQHIGENSFVLNSKGEKVGEAEEAFDIDLKSQSSLIKKGLVDELQLPVFVCENNGEIINIFPCYGAGLWGPIWGYVAVADDFETIIGATFDHKSETPGLGGEIATAKFQSQFPGKKLVKNGSFHSIQIVKGGAQGDENGVDAITGATITSKSLDNAIATWLEFYQPYFNIKKGAVASTGCCSGDECTGDCEEGHHHGEGECNHEGNGGHHHEDSESCGNCEHHKMVNNN